MSREITVKIPSEWREEMRCRSGIERWLLDNASSLYLTTVGISRFTVIFYEDDDATLYRLWLA
ncbi:MAG: hypothetical protein EOO77_28120 [Oxalobacteraceae bacterium]|nr:MAG: hypothetical protein EOO77_28120 [Oxalobacteraceae bacterium]